MALGGEHFSVVAIPVALKSFGRVVVAFEAEEVGELGVAGFDLLARRPAMVGEVVVAAHFNGAGDEAAKVGLRFTDARRAVCGVEVEDDAGVILFCPGEKTFVVALDEPDCAVDQLDGVAAEIASHRFEKI